MKKTSFVSLTFLALYLPLGVMAEKVEPQPGNQCFTMTPLSAFDDKKCGPVTVDIQFVDCKDQSIVVDKVTNVSARFECKRNPKRLKYWHNDTMLFAQVEKSGNTYVIKSTSSVVYGKKDPSTAVVPAPSAVKDLSAPVVDAGPSLPQARVAFEASAVPTPSPTPVPELAPVAQTKEVIPPPVAPTTSLINDIKISGSIDAYYLYNQNQPAAPVPSPSPTLPPNETATYLPGMYHDQFTVKYAVLDFTKEAKPVGFKIGTVYGAGAFVFGDSETDLANFALYEAYFTYKTPFDLEIEAGKFESFIGLEKTFPSKNVNYTLSLGRIWATPVWFSGVKLKYPLGDWFTLSFYLLNGWNKMYETNSSKSFGGQIKFAPSESFEINLNSIGGNETQSGGADIRSTIEGQVIFKPSSSLLFAVDFINSQESISGGDPRRVSSLAGYFKYGFMRAMSLAARYEIYTDDELFTSGTISATPPIPPTATAQTINSITGTLIYDVTEKMSVKAEYRMDTSTTTPYRDPQGQPIASQNLSLLSGMMSF